MNNLVKTGALHNSFLIVLAKIGTLCKISIVFGAFHAFFSLSSVTVPLFGIFAGTLGSILFFVISLSARLLLGYGFSFKILAFYVPGLCASLYLAQRSWVWAIAVPLLCMLLFGFHSVGSQAMVYSAYWFVPMLLFFVPQQTLFTRAMTATFIAHAVGSVIWLYAQPATPAFWMALLPIVALERLLYAVGMVCVHKVIVLMCDHIIQASRCSRFEKLRLK